MATTLNMSSGGEEDFAGLDDVDPSLSEGHIVVYDRECPFELRIEDSAQAGPGQAVEPGTLEAIKCKIVVLGEGERSYSHCRVELSSENDLFFHFTHSADEQQFKRMQEQQRLMVEFNEYVTVLIKMLNSSIKEPRQFLSVLTLDRSDGHARLDFIQNMEYKFVELLSCDFVASPEEVVRQHISFRYNNLKSKLGLMQARLQDINAIMKVKNPSLLLQINKAAPGTLAAGGAQLQSLHGHATTRNTASMRAFK